VQENIPRDASLDELLEFFNPLGKVAIIRRRVVNDEFQVHFASMHVLNSSTGRRVD
jgi:hypothetical protein